MDRTRTARIVAGTLSIAAAVAMAATTLTSASAIAKGASVKYSKPITVPAPPKSSTGAAGNGDGFDLSFDNGNVYNVFHSVQTLQVDCHVQATGAQCPGFATPVTVQAPGGVDFKPPIQATATAIDPTTHHLFTYATAPTAFGSITANAAGVVEIDLDPNATNRFVRFIQGARNSTGGGYIGFGVLVGSRFYAVNGVSTMGATTDDSNKLMCVDISTSTTCPGQPYAIGLNDQAMSPSGVILSAIASGTRIFVDDATATKTWKTACFDTATSKPCGVPWPKDTGTYDPTTFTPKTLYPLLDASGARTGLCSVLTTTDCFDFTGATVAPLGIAAALPEPFSFRSATLGSRLYVPLTSMTGYVSKLGCYDFAAQASCPGFPVSYPKPVYVPYTVQADPANPSCLWINADNTGTWDSVNKKVVPDPNGARIQAIDAFTGGTCGASGSRVLMSSFIEPASGCEPSRWGTLTVTSTTALTSASVKVQDANGTDIATATMNLSNGNLTATLDLSTVTLTAGGSIPTTTPYPSILLDLQDANGAVSAATTAELTWDGTYDSACTANGQTANLLTATTTTAAPTTTTIAETTTTVADTTTTVAGATTTTVAGATTTTAPATTTTAGPATTTTTMGATTTTIPATTTTAGPATTIVYVTGNTVLVTPFTSSTTTVAPTTTAAPAPVATSVSTVPVSVLGAVVTASPANVAPAAAPATGMTSSPAYTGSNDLDLTLFALALLAVAALVLGGERITRREQHQE